MSVTRGPPGHWVLQHQRPLPCALRSLFYLLWLLRPGSLLCGAAV